MKPADQWALAPNRPSIAMCAAGEQAILRRPVQRAELCWQAMWRVMAAEAPTEDQARRKLIHCIEQWDGESEYDAEDQAALADDILHAFNGPPLVSEEAPKDAAPAIARIEYEMARAERVESLSASIRVDDLRAVMCALRAQPQVRDDAQPVAWGGAADIEYLKTSGRDGLNARSAMFALPNPNRIALYTHPAPDALRDVARHAATVMHYLDEYGASIVPHLIDTDDNPGQRLREALAALQAKQRAK